MDRELLSQASSFARQGEWENAAGLYESFLAQAPDHIEALLGLGTSLVRLGRLSQATPILSKAVLLGSEDPLAFVALGDAYFGLGEAQASARAYEEAVARLPQSARARVKLAHALTLLGQAEQAEELLIRAIELEPALAAAHDLAAFVLPQMGRFEEARKYAQRSLAIEPSHPGYSARYIYGSKVSADDRGVVERLTRLAQSGTLNTRSQIQAEFSLGKANEDLGQYRQASTHYVCANALCDQAKLERDDAFHRASHRSDVDLILENFSECASDVSGASESDLPVFVIGMMRSGSTLAEQILSSHPEVGGAGEVPFWIDRAPDLLRSIADGGSSSRVAEMAYDYASLLRKLAPNRRRVCDKLLQNYMAVGMLHATFPNARFIHCRRDPRDTCLSIFTTPFAYPPPFAYRADTIAFAYREYLRLMARWRSILPADRFLEIDYEELVTDRERVSRQMIEFVGLDWSEACLAPEKNPRLVGNPSQWQVRQPVYGTSIGRWRRFVPWLNTQLAQWDVSMPQPHE